MMDLLDIIKCIRDFILLISIYFIYFMVGYYAFIHTELTSQFVSIGYLVIYYYMVIVVFISLIITTYVLHNFRLQDNVYHIYSFERKLAYLYTGIIWILMASCGFIFRWLSIEFSSLGYHYPMLGAYILLILVNYLIHYKYIEQKMFGAEIRFLLNDP